MKKCPQCKSVYTDDTLSFCLSDGTPLISGADDEQFDEPEKTLELPNTDLTAETFSRKTAQSTPPGKTATLPVSGNKVSRFWIYATVGLLGVLLAGLIGFGLYFLKFPTEFAQNIENKPAVLNPDTPEAVKNSDSAKPFTPTPTPKATPRQTTYRVIGVKSKDVLYIRPGPGNLKTYLGKIPPDGTGIIVSGGGRRVGKSIWLPVRYKGISGWVNGRYIKKEGS